MAGSEQSNIRFVVSSKVLHVPNLDDDAAWCATKEEYLPLQKKEMIVWKGGTSLIFVPSGKTLDFDPYHFDSCCLKAITLLEVHSR